MAITIIYMHYRYLVLFIVFDWAQLWLTGKSNAQQPVTHIVYDTICGGQSLYGYSISGTYTDTYTLPGYDSTRILHLRVLPADGWEPLPSFFNTGSDGAGGILGGGNPDLHWSVSSGSINGPYGPAVVMTSIPGNYSPSPWPDCKWIAHTASGDHTTDQTFYYKIEFELPCFNACGDSHNQDSIFCLKLDFMADNSIHEIYVNGFAQSTDLGNIIPVSGPYTYVGFQTPNAVSPALCHNWKAGHNVLIIKILSSPGQSGFLAQATATPPPPPLAAAFGLSVVNGVPYNDTGCAPYLAGFTNASINANTYLWDFGDGSPTSDVENPAHTFTDPGVYPVRLIAYNSFECTRRDTSELLIVVQNEVSFPVYDSFCSNEPYVFNGIKIYSPGVYTARYSRPQDCDSLVILNLALLEPPLVGIHVTDEEEYFCLGDSVSLSGSGARDYIWISNGAISHQQPYRAYLSAPSNNIRIVGIAQNGCRDTAGIIMNTQGCCQMFVPNAFSPNMDGRNDHFMPSANGHFRNYQLSVYNRWGQRVFNSLVMDNGWDGTYKGIPAELGTYYYYISGYCLEGTEIRKKGNFLLVR